MIRMILHVGSDWMLFDRMLGNRMIVELAAIGGRSTRKLVAQLPRGSWMNAVANVRPPPRPPVPNTSRTPSLLRRQLAHAAETQSGIVNSEVQIKFVERASGATPVSQTPAAGGGDSASKRAIGRKN